MDKEQRFIFISGTEEGVVVNCGSQEVMINRAVNMLSWAPGEEFKYQ